MPRKWITLSIVRHAQSVSNVTHSYQIRDAPLTEHGEVEADALGKRWANVHIDHFYSSPLKRAYSTAQAIARHNSAAPPIVADGVAVLLVEKESGEAVRDVPAWDRDSICKILTGQSFRYQGPPDRTFRPADGGESFEAVALRARIFLDTVVAYGVELDSEDKPAASGLDERIPHILVVSHNIFLKELFETMRFFNSPKDRYETTFFMGNTSMARYIIGLDPDDKESMEMITVVRAGTIWD